MNSQNLVTLRETAKTLKIKYYYRLKKAELIAAIELI